MNQSTRDSLYDQLTRNTLFLILLPIVGILIGWFGFIRPQFDNVPVTRAEAQTVSGSFEEYEVSKNYRGLIFSDGTSYPVYPHTETAEFQDRMKSLEKGTHLTIAIHPKSGCVIEIRTDTEELLNFETSQQEIYQYGKGYIWIGAFFILAPESAFTKRLPGRKRTCGSACSRHGPRRTRRDGIPHPCGMPNRSEKEGSSCAPKSRAIPSITVA